MTTNSKTKHELYSQGIRADATRGNHYFICCECSNEWRSTRHTDNHCTTCGNHTPEYHYIEHIEETVHPPVQFQGLDFVICYDDKKLLQARKEALLKVTKLYRHLYQCEKCKTIHEQSDFETVDCPNCDGVMTMRYTYVNLKDKTVEFYAGNGAEVTKEIHYDNLLKCIRKKQKLSQDELAELLNVSQVFVCKMENGEKPYTSDSIKWIYANMK